MWQLWPTAAYFCFQKSKVQELSQEQKFSSAEIAIVHQNIFITTPKRLLSARVPPKITQI